jgi:hypothetical protein
VIELGKGVCEAYDVGGTTTEIGANIALSGVMTIAQTGYFVGVTTSSYCPGHNGRSSRYRRHSKLHGVLDPFERGDL